jgi:hypothetical protein
MDITTSDRHKRLQGVPANMPMACVKNDERKPGRFCGSGPDTAGQGSSWANRVCISCDAHVGEVIAQVGRGSWHEGTVRASLQGGLLRSVAELG